MFVLMKKLNGDLVNYYLQSADARQKEVKKFCIRYKKWKVEILSWNFFSNWKLQWF